MSSVSVTPEDIETQPKLGRVAAPWMALIVGVLLSVFIFTVIRADIEREAGLRFDRYASDAKHVMEARIHSYADILYGLRGAFAASEGVNRVKFRRLYQSLDLKRRYPGFEVVNFAARVTADDKKRFEESVRRDTSVDPAGYPDFAIKPPGERAEYHVLTFVEPMSLNKFAFGLDLGANPAIVTANPKVLEALQYAARDSGQVTASGQQIRIKGRKEFVGLSMRLAVYRNGMPTDTVAERRAAYLGSVGAGFNVENLVDGLFDTKTAQYMQLKLVDIGPSDATLASLSGAKERLLFSSKVQDEAAAEKLSSRNFSKALRTEVGGRLWEIQFAARKDAIIDRVDALMPWMVLTAGLLCSVLLFGMFYALSSSRTRAVRLAGTIAKELQEREAEMASAQHIAQFGNWLLDPKSGTMSLSAETHRIFGLAIDSSAVTYADFLQLVHENDRPHFEQAVRDSIESRQDRELDHRIFWNDGIVRWVRTVAKPTLRSGGLVVSGTSKDITEERLAAARLQVEHRVTQLAASTDDLTHAMADIIQSMAAVFGCECGTYWSLDKDSSLLRCSEHWGIEEPLVAEFLSITEKLSFPQGVEIPGRAWAVREPIFVPDFSHERSFSRLAAAAKANLRSALAFPVKSATQFFGTVELFSSEILQPDKSLQHLLDSIGSFMGQCLQRNRAEQALRHLAGHDPLTELSNRNFFNDRLGHALSQAARHKRGVALIFVDMDRFKIVNDTLGHSAGDRVLQECAQRLTASLRDSDVVSRLGGDEFVVTLENLAQPRDAIAVAQKILSSLSRPFVVEQQEFQLSASVGISVFPNDGSDVETLLQNADAAMYRAKGQGGNVYQFYSAEMNKHTFERVALESSLRHAIERNQLLLHYQPKVDMRTGRITGVEALVRWQHPDLGIVSPAQFIPLAEETGLIVQIGEWVLTTACKQFRIWQEMGVSLPRVAINLSARQFLNDRFVSDVKRIVASSGMRAEDLEFEITESMVIQNPEHAVRLLTELKAIGSYLSLDDFGTGYSSLAYLKRFPIDCVKIDRSFILDIPKEVDDMALTRGIIALAHSLRMKVVAEGVETPAQSEFLAANDCDELQGFLFSKPLSADDLFKLLKTYMPKPHLSVVRPPDIPKKEIR